MMMPKIQDSFNTMIYVADLVPMAAHIPLPWVMAYDMQPVLTIQEKRVLLPKAVDENWHLFFEHDPIHQACTVQFDGRENMSESLDIAVNFPTGTVSLILTNKLKSMKKG